MNRTFWFAPILFFALTPSVRAGQPRTHDGFFLRMAGGVVVANTKFEPNPESEPDWDSVEHSGTGSDYNFAIGGVIGRNLALHGTLWLWNLPDADTKINGQDQEKRRVGRGAIGGGVTYYFGPSNVYVSGSVGLGQHSNTDWGPVLAALLGKEWWVGNSWGLGIAGDFNVHSLPVNGGEGRWNGISFGILFSATLN